MVGTAYIKGGADTSLFAAVRYPDSKMVHIFIAWLAECFPVSDCPRKFSGTDSIQSQISFKTSRGRKDRSK